MKHKHAELIKAWADGAQIQWLDSNCNWCNIACTPSWSIETTYRIKPEPKPDWYKFFRVYTTCGHVATWQSCSPVDANLHLTFDGDTNKLKKAEVI